jgi:hypothetical protein
MMTSQGHCRRRPSCTTSIGWPPLHPSRLGAVRESPLRDRTPQRQPRRRTPAHRHIQTSLPLVDTGQVRLWLVAVAASAAACGAQVDGDQWHRVTVRDDLNASVSVNGHPLAPGRTTILTVNQNTGSGAYGVSDDAGRPLGCLPVDHDQTLLVSNLPPCPGARSSPRLVHLGRPREAPVPVGEEGFPSVSRRGGDGGRRVRVEPGL